MSSGGELSILLGDEGKSCLQESEVDRFSFLPNKIPGSTTELVPLFAAMARFLLDIGASESRTRHTIMLSRC